MPIWSIKTETATRIQQRLFWIFGYAKIKKWYEKDNPALWKGGLQEIMLDPFKIHKVKNFASLKYEKVTNFYQDLCEMDFITVYALRLLILTLDGIRDLKPSRGEITDDDLRYRVYELIDLSNNMPKNR